MRHSESVSTRWSRRDALLGVLLFFVILSVYWPVRQFDYVRFDDPVFLFENPQARHGLTRQSAGWAFHSLVMSNYMPVSVLSALADVSLWGLRPGPIHLMNVIYHAGSTAGWYLLWVMLTGRRARSFAVAGIFGLHPMHVEPVAWIVERCDVLCMLLMVCILLAYAGYARSGRKALYFVALALYPMAVLAKAIAVVIPAVILLLNVWPLRRLAWAGRRRPGDDLLADDAAAVSAVPANRLVVELIPFGLLALATAAITFAGRFYTYSLMSLQHWPLAYRLANVTIGYNLYLFKAIWPEPMVVLYPLVPARNGTTIIAASGLLALLTALAIRARLRRPYVLIGWLWFVIALLPSIGIVQTGSQSIADRYTYLPYVGLSVIVVWWVGDLLAVVSAKYPIRGRVIGSALCGLMLLACSVESRRQLQYWRSSFALFKHAAEFEPADPVINRAIATEYSLRGRPDLAIAYYGRSLEENPDNGDTEIKLADLLMRIDPRLALPHFEVAVRVKSDDAQAWWKLGSCQQQMGQGDAAAFSYRRSVVLDPNFEPARIALQSQPGH